MIVQAFALCTTLLLLTQSTALSASPPKISAIVSFIGCRSDGHAGVMSPPSARSIVLPLSRPIAKRVAYYESSWWLGVLGPLGWHCVGVYGSSETALYVSPDRIEASNLFSDSHGFTGPSIEIAAHGRRSDVARTIARIFPAHREFVESVITEGTLPAGSFPSGPYANDKLIYKTNEVVEYETPANTDGLGTQSRLKKSSDPIRGVEILVGKMPDLAVTSLAVRLSPDQADLISVIIQQFEGDARPTASRDK